MTPVYLDKDFIIYVDFTAKRSVIDDAPEDLFFGEIIVPEGTVFYCVRLCISLGALRDYLSGLILTCILWSCLTTIGCISFSLAYSCVCLSIFRPI